MRIVLATLTLLLGAVVGAAPANLVANGSFEDGTTGWKPGAGVTVEAAADGTHFLKCANVGDGIPSSATSAPITVKPNAGYRARCKFRIENGAHYTFGVVKPDGSFVACRDVYGCSTEQWDQSLLPFRTEGQTQLCMYVARRYGGSAIFFDDVELIEDDAVTIGDVSPQPNPFPALTAPEQARGFVVAAQPWLKLIYSKSYPAREDMARPLRCQLTPGEAEPMTLALTAAKPLTGVRAQLFAPLTDKRGHRLPDDAVSLGVVGLMKRYVTNAAPLQAGQCFERRPFLIYPNQPFDVPEHETRQLWITVHAPDDQRPGEYQGSVQIVAGGASLLVPMSVRVLPIKLQAAKPTYGMYYRLTDQPEGYKTEAFFRRCMTDMRDHGMNSMSVYIHPERKLGDGTWEVDLDRDTDRYSLVHQMTILSETGMASPDHPQLLLAADCRGTFFNGEKTIAAIEALRRERQWPELLFYLVDEPSSKAQYDMAKSLNGVVHRVPGVRTTTALGAPGELADYYDVWICSTSSENVDDIIKLGREKQKEVWTYNCQWNGTQPYNDRYFCGYHMWSTGMRGNWQWCYTEGYAGSSKLTDEVPFQNPTYEEPWYVNYVLPTAEGNLPTLGWEGRREGIDDYRYLQTLRAAMDAAKPKQRKIVTAAQAFLDATGKRLVPPKRPLPATNSDRNYGLVMHPGLGPEDYDAIRAQAAEFIIKLQGKTP